MGIQTFPHKRMQCHPDFVNFLASMNDGSDGAWTPSTGSQSWGIYRYTNVNISSGVTVTVSNAPLIILATQAITIAGTLTANGQGAAGGATQPGYTGHNRGKDGAGRCGAGGGGGGGAFNGSGGGSLSEGGGNTDFAGGQTKRAQGNAQPTAGQNGGGAGGDRYAAPYITTSLKDLATWKGAGGSSGDIGGGNMVSGVGGNGGGNIILLAPLITITGTVSANGHDGTAGQSFGANNSAGSGGGGGGGCVILFGSTLSITGTVTANGGVGGPKVTGGTFEGAAGGNGGVGFVLKGLL